MTAHPAVPRLAMLLLLAGCGGDAPTSPTPPPPPATPTDPAPVEPQPDTEPGPTSPLREGYALHEWGLMGVEVGSPHGTVSTSVAHPPLSREAIGEITHGAGRGPGVGATGKPVIYLHLPNDAPPQDIAVTLPLPSPRVLEHWPPATDAGGTLTWQVRAARGACASPAAAPTAADAACRDVRDGFCEAMEIPRYHGDDDTCLTVGGLEAPLLFYRGDGTDASQLPLTLRARAPEQAPDTAPDWEVVRQTEEAVAGPVLLVRRLNGHPSIHVLQGPDYAMPAAEAPPISSDAARATLHAEALRRGLTTHEADAFVDAWAPAYFGAVTRPGPLATGRPPTALADVDNALLYFAPAAVVDAALPLTLAPAPTVQHRVFLVRVVDATSRANPEPTRAPPPGSLGLGHLGVGGGPMPGIHHPDGAPVRVRLGAPTVQGPLDSAIVRRVVARNQAQLLHCYEQLLNRQPEAGGRVIVAFVVAPSGSVSAASVRENATGDTGLASCVANAVRRWSYPERDAVTAVQLPFHLSVRD